MGCAKSSSNRRGSPASMSARSARRSSTNALDEIGALPLVENALFTLWQQRQGNVLSGERYRESNGIAGMLSAQADALLARIDGEVAKGRQAALELLLWLTRINDEGRHTRQRIPRDQAARIAGDGKAAAGERVLQLLSGERRADVPRQRHAGSLRLITISTEQEQQYVDLIHETLIRARGKDEQTGKAIGYWPTLYDYIEKNRDRDMLRQQLRFQAEQWGRAVLSDAGGTLPAGTISGATGGCASTCAQRKKGASCCGVGGRERCSSSSCWRCSAAWAKAVWWASRNNLPFDYTVQKPLWFLSRSPAIRRCRRWWTSRREASRWAACRDATTSKARPAARTTSRIR
jgi:hypothetical protein